MNEHCNSPLQPRAQLVRQALSECQTLLTELDEEARCQVLIGVSADLGLYDQAIAFAKAAERFRELRIREQRACAATMCDCSCEDYDHA